MPKYRLSVLLLLVGFGLNVVTVKAWKTDASWLEAKAPFMQSANETIHELKIRSAPIDVVQRRIDAARADHPDSVLVIRLDGRFDVGQNPILLGSRMILFLEEGSALVADSEWAGHLIEIRDAVLSGVFGPGAGLDPAVIDGNMRSPAGITIINSARTHLAYLHIKNCLGNGIEYTGRGADRFGQAGSITHCRIQGNSGSGVVVRDVAQFVFTDNVLIDNEEAGIDIVSHTSVVADNLFRGHPVTGVISGSENGVVARNTFRSGGGIRLTGESDATLLTYNRFMRTTGAAIAINGQRNAIYYNEFYDVNRAFSIAGERNIIASHRNVEDHRQGVITRHADGCVFLHNVFRHNEIGIRVGMRATENNHIAQNLIYHNHGEDVSEQEKTLAPDEFFSFSGYMLDR